MLVYREFSFQNFLIKLLLWNFRSEDDVLTHIIFFSNIYRPPLYKKCFIELNHITILSFISADWIALTKAMAPHSITLAWKIPWTEEPGRLQSMGSQRVGHHWATSLSLFHFHALEKEMATHSSVLSWRIPGMGEPGGLPSMGSHRVGHDWSNLAAVHIYQCKLISLQSCSVLYSDFRVVMSPGALDYKLNLMHFIYLKTAVNYHLFSLFCKTKPKIGMGINDHLSVFLGKTLWKM